MVITQPLQCYSCEANTKGVHTSVQADVLDIVAGSVHEQYRCGGIVFWVRIRVVSVFGGDSRKYLLVEVEAESCEEGTEVVRQLCHVRPPAQGMELCDHSCPRESCQWFQDVSETILGFTDTP